MADNTTSNFPRVPTPPDPADRPQGLNGQGGDPANIQPADGSAPLPAALQPDGWQVVRQPGGAVTSGTPAGLALWNRVRNFGRSFSFGEFPGGEAERGRH